VFHSGLFLFQIAVIVGVSRAVAWLFGKIGQPQVIGEMVAGVMLGPTLLGFFAPDASSALFPPESLGYLNALSQAGLVIFIFLIGVRVDFDELRHQSRVAAISSAASVLPPFLMGIALAPYLVHRYGSGNPTAFAPLIGTAMSVTAFPVLARILAERKMIGTRLGTVAIACAAASDLFAWISLAVVVSMTERGKGSRPFWQMLVLIVLYGLVLWCAGRLLHWWARRLPPEGLRLEMLVAFVVAALLSGAAGEWIGIHAMVGAFAAGLITPREFRAQLIDKLETITLVVLIPLFFALTGIRTNLIFTSGIGAYGDLALIVFIAIAGKWGGTLLGARAGGMAWRDASELGVLMNARGLVELIVLNIGLESGILPPAVFSMMVCMALFTTFITSPLLTWFEPKAAAPLRAN
jgi:Kef-type K+ transport system membrane component KefB